MTIDETTDNDRDDTEREWWAEQGHVLKKSKSGDYWHVTGRFEDVDDGTRKYELWDDTHTVREYWHAEDVEDCFEKTSAVVLHSRKPLQVLDGRLYGNAFDDCTLQPDSEHN